MDRRHFYVASLKQLAIEMGLIPTREDFLRLKGTNQTEMENIFGTFTQLIQASGLRPNRKASYKSELDKHSQKREAYDLLLNKFKTDIEPLNHKYGHIDKQAFKILVCSDLHADYLDPFAWEMFLTAARFYQPEVVVLAGDVLDCYAISSYSKDPRRINSFATEIDFVKKNILESIRNALPKAQIDFILGNHEVRLWKMLVANAPALAFLPSLSYAELLSLDAYKINLVASQSILNPKPGSANYKVYGDPKKGFCITHGTKCSGQHAEAELKTWNLNGCSGHVHHYQVASKRDMSGGTKTWTSIGCMCRIETGEDYCDFPKWQQGFGIAHVYKDQSQFEYVAIQDALCHIGRRYYFR